MTHFKQMSLFENSSEPCQVPYVLLSLQPEWYQLILSGQKKYEYRRKYLKQESIAFIYVSSTTKAICAKINFGKPIIAPIEEIVKIREAERSGGGDGIRAYMEGLKEGFAIPIVNCQQIEPISLDELRQRWIKFTAPQSYILLDSKKDLLNFLLQQPLIVE